jgi:hypothetical protein
MRLGMYLVGGGWCMQPWCECMHGRQHAVGGSSMLPSAGWWERDDGGSAAGGGLQVLFCINARRAVRRAKSPLHQPRRAALQASRLLQQPQLRDTVTLMRLPACPWYRLASCTHAAV